MASPSNPTLNELVLEALAKAGESNPTTALIDRAEDKWMEEIKQDIYRRGKKLKSLMVTSGGILTTGKQRYSNPSDYESDLSMTLLDYGTTYSSTLSGINYIYIDSDDPGGDGLIGKQFFISNGTSTGFLFQVIYFNSSYGPPPGYPAIGVTPTPIGGAGTPIDYSYIDNEYPLEEKVYAQYDSYKSLTSGTPSYFFPIGDEDYGEFILNCPPDKNYGVRFNYYANLMTLDLDSTHMSYLYLKWRNLWLVGLMWKKFQEANDDRENRYFNLYQKELNDLVNMETYGADISNIRELVTDFM